MYGIKSKRTNHHYKWVTGLLPVNYIGSAHLLVGHRGRGLVVPKGWSWTLFQLSRSNGVLVTSDSNFQLVLKLHSELSWFIQSHLVQRLLIGVGPCGFGLVMVGFLLGNPLAWLPFSFHLFLRLVYYLFSTRSSPPKFSQHVHAIFD